MDRLISDLNNQWARNFLYVPSSLSLQSAFLKIINKIDPNIEIALVTLDKSQINLPNVSNFQIAQISQAFLNIFFSDLANAKSRLLIIEASANLGQFNVPQGVGRILVLGSPFKSMLELSETVKFLSGSSVDHLTLTSYLGQIGYQLTSLDSNFVYQGNVVTLNMLPSQYSQYLQTNKSQTLNMVYPIDAQRKPDIPLNEGGWITLELLPKVSPKIFWLIEYLKMNRGKHVIYTVNSESIIDSFLRLAGYNVVSVSGNDRQQERNVKIKTFNDTLTPIVLISDLSIIPPIRDLTSFIMFEQHSTDNVFNNYIKAISSPSYERITKVRFLPIVFLISLGPQNESTLDVQNYTNMVDLLNQRDAIFEILIDPTQTTKYSQVFNIDDFNLFKDENGYPLRFILIPI
jgi:hypothetical protein